jgi:hypothetical protein
VLPTTPRCSCRLSDIGCRISEAERSARTERGGARRDGQTKLRASAQKGQSGPSSTYQVVRTLRSAPSLQCVDLCTKHTTHITTGEVKARHHLSSKTCWHHFCSCYCCCDYATVELTASSQCTLNKLLYRTFVPFGNSRKFNLFHQPRTSLSAVTEVENPTCSMRSNSFC